jgi:hypothetical protein
LGEGKSHIKPPERSRKIKNRDTSVPGECCCGKTYQ